MRSHRTSRSSSTSSGAPASEDRGDRGVDLVEAVAVAEVGGRVGVDEEPVALARDRGAGEHPSTCSGVSPRMSALVTAVHPPHVAERRPREGGVAVAEAVGGEQERLVVAEEAADGAVALALETADEVDRAEAVGAAVDEIADEPEDGVGAGPPLRGVDQAAPTEERRERVAMAVDVAHDEHGCRHPYGTVAPDRARFGSSTTRRSAPTSSSVSPSETSRSRSASSASSQSESIGERVIRSIFGCGLGVAGLAGADELLVELLARRRPDELDRDVGPRLLPREPDHLLREVDDPHRLAHVEHVDLTAAADRAGLDDELHRLGDRHEEARHLRMRHGDGAAPRDLAPEDRHDRPGRAEDVAEAHRDEPRRRRPPGGPTSRRSTPRAPSTGPSPSSGSRPCRSRRARTAWRRTRRRRRRPRACRSCCSGRPRSGSPPSARRACTRRRGRRRRAGTCRRPGAAWRRPSRPRRPRRRRGTRARGRAPARSRTAPARRGRAARASPAERARSGGRARSRSSRRRPSRARPRPRRTRRSPRCRPPRARGRARPPPRPAGAAARDRGRPRRGRRGSAGSSPGRGARRAVSTIRARSSPDAVGIAMSTSSGRRSRRTWARSAVVPSTRTPWSRRFRLRGSSSSSPIGV